VLGDADRLRQVVDNLLTNALKFTPSGEHVRVDSDRVDGRCLLRVQDDGKGIPPGEIARVFDAFHQADSSSTRREGGLGLGLSIVKHIVREHCASSSSTTTPTLAMRSPRCSLRRERRW
jgi:signal transduction histidine kinase